jgi:hypothetical protein
VPIAVTYIKDMVRWMEKIEQRAGFPTYSVSTRSSESQSSADYLIQPTAIYPLNRNHARLIRDWEMSVALGKEQITTPGAWFRSNAPYKALWEGWWAAISMDNVVLLRGGGGTLLAVIATLTSWMLACPSSTDAMNARLRDLVSHIASAYVGST